MDQRNTISICNAMRKLILSCTAIALCACQPTAYFNDHYDRWAVYYGTDAQAQAFTPYSLAVLDSAEHPDIHAIHRTTPTVLGYLSVGEVDATHDPKNAPATLIEKNPLWNSQMVDIRQPDWQKYLIERKVPAILAKGFDGVMLDTVDSALYLEEKEPEKYKGMKDAAIYIVKALRYRYPNMPIMLNRGFAIWPEVAPQLTSVLAESTFTITEGPQRTPRLQTADAYRQYIKKLKEAKAYNENLIIYSLDYWDMNDRKGVSRIYKAQRKQGLIPYVSTPDLKKIYHEIKASIIAPTGEEGIVYA